MLRQNSRYWIGRLRRHGIGQPIAVAGRYTGSAAWPFFELVDDRVVKAKYGAPDAGYTIRLFFYLGHWSGIFWISAFRLWARVYKGGRAHGMID